MSEKNKTAPLLFDDLLKTTEITNHKSTTATPNLPSDGAEDQIETTGNLPPEARQALMSLLKKGVLLAADKPKIFAALCRYEIPISQHLADLYLQLLLDHKAGVAYVKQQEISGDESDKDAISLFARRTLTLYDTLILLVVRKYYQERETAGETKVIIGLDLITANLTPFLPLTNSDRMDDKKVKGALGRFVEHKLLIKVRADDERFEITPIIRYVVNAEFLDQLLNEYLELAQQAS